MTLAAPNARGAASYVNERWVHGAFGWRYAEHTALRRNELALAKKWPSLKGHFLLTSRPNGGDA